MLNEELIQAMKILKRQITYTDLDYGENDCEREVSEITV